MYYNWHQSHFSHRTWSNQALETKRPLWPAFKVTAQEHDPLLYEAGCINNAEKNDPIYKASRSIN